LNPPWHIALIANLKTDFEPEEDDPPDAGSEFDSLRTIQAISEALQADGHRVTFLSADETLPISLADLQPDFCFNIAEGLQGDGREAQVPALCELLGIPYTASRVVSNAIGLDKAHTKRIWRDAGLPTAGFIEARTLRDLQSIAFEYPMFVKPAREGSGMGITQGSIVRDQQELASQVAYTLEKYNQPALVEEFLPGREFTVGFIGNPGSSHNRRFPELYDADGYHFFPILEIDSGISVSPAVYGQQAKSFAVGTTGAPGYLCPADISPGLRQQLIDLTRQAAEALGVCDVSRVDFRLDTDHQPRLLEINTLPGLSPGYSDLCIQANAENMPYQILITEILYLAAERYRMAIPLPVSGPGIPYSAAAIH
jgi:D-alanine-D-alanine ligase